MALHGPRSSPSPARRRAAVGLTVSAAAVCVGALAAAVATGGALVTAVAVLVAAVALGAVAPVALERTGLLGGPSCGPAPDEELAIKDPLTGLLNHAAFSERLGVELRRGQREGYRVAVVVVDIDHFQQINDGWGHAVGDEALRLVAEQIVTELRPSDLVGRIGGDQFVLGLVQTGGREGVEVINRVRAGVSSIAFNPTKQRITLSAGVSLFPYDAADVESLMRQAEDALRRSKLSGRDRSTAYADMAAEPVPPTRRVLLP